MKVHPVMEKAKKFGSGLLKWMSHGPKPSSRKVRDSIVVIGVKQAMLLGMLSAQNDSQQEDSSEDLYEDIETSPGESPCPVHEMSLPQSSSDSSSKPRGKLVRWEGSYQSIISNIISLFANIFQHIDFHIFQADEGRPDDPLPLLQQASPICGPQILNQIEFKIYTNVFAHFQ